LNPDHCICRLRAGRLAIGYVVVSLCLAACAGRTHKPEEPLQPISRVAMLPVMPAEDVIASASPERGPGPQLMPTTGLGGRPLGAGDVADQTAAD
jgi:hypothetical protein